VRERINALYGAQGRFALAEGTPRGTRASIEESRSPKPTRDERTDRRNERAAAGTAEGNASPRLARARRFAEAAQRREALQQAEATNGRISPFSTSGCRCARDSRWRAKSAPGCHFVFVTAYDEYAVASVLTRERSTTS
jgi:hypothetical protein